MWHEYIDKKENAPTAVRFRLAWLGLAWLGLALSNHRPHKQNMPRLNWY
jgi:hypothetical protein